MTRATRDANFAVGYLTAGYLLGWREGQLELPGLRGAVAQQVERWQRGYALVDQGGRAKVLAAGVARIVASLEERAL